LATTEQWGVHTRHTLQRYDEALLRQVAHKLCKPRNQWPVHELLDRVVAGLTNLPLVDRRLKELPVACRQILCVIALSRQPRWPVGSLVEILVALGHADGLAPLTALLESGLLLPELYPFGTDPDQQKSSARTKLKSLESWLSRSEPMPIVLASPFITKRTANEDLGLVCPAFAPVNTNVHEADGMEWPVRLAVIWQQVIGAPLRRTQQGDFFKRDFERLKGDPLLSAAVSDAVAQIPDPGFFTAALASALELLRVEEAELHAGAWSAAWKSPLPTLIVELWTSLSRISTWNPAVGHAPGDGAGNPYPSAYLLALLLLARLPENDWTKPAAVEKWVATRHPYWADRKTASPGLSVFLLGIAYTLRLLQTSKGEDGDWLIRLSPLGRWVMGLTEKPPTLTGFPQTLLVQPNLEILAYRQGLTPELIASLSKIATWKTLGAACTLQLEPQSVYRALEMGESLARIVQLLESHGMKAIPTTVLESLKTWSSKRERISVYSAGAIFEFGSAAEMSEAIARGLDAVRLTDRLAIVANESAIEYKNFRLTGTRDYTLPPERCVDVEADGVTLTVDLGRSDLLLETELLRFAEPIAATEGSSGRPTAQNRSQYRITPGSIMAARQQGANLPYLQHWFAQRTGMPISAAAQLLMSGPDAAPVELRRQLILHVGNEHLADGLQQWPATRDLIVGRLGPTALIIEEKNTGSLLERLKDVGVQMRFEG
jgi:hypothetical protein